MNTKQDATTVTFYQGATTLNVTDRGTHREYAASSGAAQFVPISTADYLSIDEADDLDAGIVAGLAAGTTDDRTEELASQLMAIMSDRSAPVTDGSNL